jgi:hypothetical protein
MRRRNESRKKKRPHQEYDPPDFFDPEIYSSKFLHSSMKRRELSLLLPDELESRLLIMRYRAAKERLKISMKHGKREYVV